MKNIRTSASLALALIFGTLNSASAAEKIAIGVPNWTGAQAIANLIEAIVTEKIVSEDTMVTGSKATIFQAMDQDKGDIDVHPDVWLPN